MPFRAGFDVGGTNARVHLFDDSLQSLGGNRERIRDATAPAELASTLVDMLEEICDDCNIAVDDVQAIGIGIAGQLSVDGRTVLNAPNLGWRNVDIVAELEEALRAHTETAPSIRIVNDLNALLWGEYRAGSIKGKDDILAVYVGTGVGGAILAGGRLLTGADANAGEIGHSKVVVGGRPCGCGERGCVEAYAGGVHLEARLAALVNESGDQDLQALKAAKGINLALADKLSETRSDVGEIWEEATNYLAMVIANACTLLNPSALLIGGGVLDNCENFRAITLQKAIPLVLEVARVNLEVHEATLGDFAGMLGAADLAG